MSGLKKEGIFLQKIQHWLMKRMDKIILYISATSVLWNARLFLWHLLSELSYSYNCVAIYIQYPIGPRI